MNMKRFSRSMRTGLMIVTLGLSLTAVSAQAKHHSRHGGHLGMYQTTTAQENGPASSDTLEEIVVYGNRNIVHLRQVVYAAEDEFFAVYNSLNSDDEYDVDCDYVFRIEAHRRLHECKAKFVKNYEEDLLQPLIFSNLATLRRKEKLLVEEMVTQVSEHPELLEVFTELAKAKRDYDSERQRRRERRSF